MGKIALYTGVGSQMSKDIEFFLKEHQIPFSKINHSEIQKGNLEDFQTLIIGGGSVFDIVPALQHSGVYEIQQFVKKGGKYVGICAGAYIACKQYYDESGTAYRGINLLNVDFFRGKGEEVVEMKTKGGKKFNLFYCNGPVLNKIYDDTKTIAKNANNEIVVLKKQYYSGEVVLFSAHPEGNLYNNISAKELGSDKFFLDILEH